MVLPNFKYTRVTTDGFRFHVRLHHESADWEQYNLSSWGECLAQEYDKVEAATLHAEALNKFLTDLIEGFPELPSSLALIFNKQGNFIHSEYDPYCGARYEDMEDAKWKLLYAFHTSIFDSLGNVHDHVRAELNSSLVDFKGRRAYAHDSDIVRMAFAQRMGALTGGSYTAVYAWKI